MFPDQLARKICYQVSILVFVELALDVLSHESQLIRRIWFQSLFSWNLLLMPIMWYVRHLEISFNPCFRGTCSWCLQDANSHRPVDSFNPCFRGTCSWCQYEEEYLEHLTKFQSLFSWNLLLMAFFRSLVLRKLRVSILVFVELALDARTKNANR